MITTELNSPIEVSTYSEMIADAQRRLNSSNINRRTMSMDASGSTYRVYSTEDPDTELLYFVKQ